MTKNYIKPLSIEISNDLSTVYIETEASNLSPHILVAYLEFKNHADDENYIVDNNNDDFSVFEFSGIHVELSRIDEEAYQVFYGGKHGIESLAVGLFGGSKFKVDLLVDKQHEKMDKLLPVIELTGIYFANPNVMDKLNSIDSDLD